VDQRRLAQQLLNPDPREWTRAAARAQGIEAANTTPELRALLISALEREAKLHLQRAKAGRRGETLEPLSYDPEALFTLIRAVVALRDPEAIPALTPALGTGFTVIRALAAFGEQAAGTVVALVVAPDTPPEWVHDGLITLRFMVDQAATHPLSGGVVEGIRQAAEQHLTVAGHLASTGVTLRWAIDLAVVLGDPSLRRIVEELASDQNEVIARGVTDPALIEQTQKRAADRLAGIPPMPRP
jgi:hypothetical protein